MDLHMTHVDKLGLQQFLEMLAKHQLKFRWTINVFIMGPIHTNFLNFLKFQKT